jgi:hypothetical protein
MVIRRHHRVHPDGAMIDGYQQGKKTSSAAEEEGSIHLPACRGRNGGLPASTRLAVFVGNSQPGAESFRSRRHQS